MNYIHPFRLDENLYSIGYIDEFNNVHITKSKRKQFPPHIVTHKKPGQRMPTEGIPVSLWRGGCQDKLIHSNFVYFLK